jgi:hypothetical protein
MSLFHPTLFVQKPVYEKAGLYDVDFKIAADFDFVLRNYLLGAKFYYVDQVIANFKQGGISVRNKVETNIECRDILYKNGYTQDVVDPVFKRWQTIHRKQKILDAGYEIVRKLFSDKIANQIAAYITNK